MDPTSAQDKTLDDDRTMSNPTPATAYEGKESDSKARLGDEEVEGIVSEMKQAVDRLREFYASGVPFFTKDAIAHLARQFDRAKKHYAQRHAPDGEARQQTFSLQALDGETAEVENEIGKVLLMNDTEELVLVNPVVEYHTYQKLVAANTDPDRFSPKLAYCPLRVDYNEKDRDRATGELLPNSKAQSLEDTEEAFYAGVKAWEASEECKRLTTALMASKTSDKITKVIAFACANFSSGHEYDEYSITQHALILTIKSILQRKKLAGDEEIMCYAQDPVYTDVERAVLEGVGIHVLDDPHAFLEVDQSSVVISISPGIPVRQIVTDIARPAIMIWDKVNKSQDELDEYWSNKSGGPIFELLDPESSRLREIVRNEYIEIHELSEDVFFDSRVYVRRF